MQAEQQLKGKILVVDDEEPVGRLLELWLTEDGYQAQWVANFDQVCQWMGKEPFNLVTLDMMMPVVNGIQTLKWLREYHPEVGVLMATALGDMDLVIEAMRLGAYSYMLKPFKLDLVAHEVARAMERQRLVAENLMYQQELEQKVEAQTHELRVANDRLEQQVKELEGRDRLVQCQLEGPSGPRACEVIMEVLYQVLGLEDAVLYQSVQDQQWLAPAAALGRGGQVALEGALGGWPKEKVAEDSLVAQVFRERKPLRLPGKGTALPLLYQEEALGVLWAKGLDGDDQQEQRHILWRLGQAAALVLWGVQVKEELDSGQVSVDELLGMQ